MVTEPSVCLLCAAAFFFFLLRKCWCGPSPLIQVIKLGVAVITSFALLWAPFCVLTAQHERGQGGCLTGLGHGKCHYRLYVLWT